MVLLESLGSFCEHFFANLEPTEQMYSPDIEQKYERNKSVSNDNVPKSKDGFVVF